MKVTIDRNDLILLLLAAFVQAYEQDPTGLGLICGGVLEWMESDGNDLKEIMESKTFVEVVNDVLAVIRSSGEQE